MIGSVGVALGVAGAVALVPLLGRGGPDPALVHAGRSLVSTNAAEALDGLEHLEAALQRGLSAARSGAAAVVAGERAPGEPLSQAADELRDAAPAQDSADAAVAALDGARVALDPAARPVGWEVPPGTVASIGAQLDGTVAAADEFAVMRLRAEGVAAALDEALAALAGEELDAAEERIGRARQNLDAVAAWDVDFATLPLWIETTHRTVETIQRIVDATRAGDGAAAREAADAFADLRNEAAVADRALRIAIGEGGAAVTAAPLGRLAEVLRAVESTSSEVASIVQTVGR